MQNTVSTQFGVYLIEFHGIIQQFIFSGEFSEVLGNLIKEHGKHGIQSIKRFDTLKSTFKKMSKSDIAQAFSWDTHSIIELQKTNFLK